MLAKKKSKKYLSSPPPKTALHLECTESNPSPSLLLKQSSEVSNGIQQNANENFCHEDKKCDLIVCTNESKPTPLDFAAVESESSEKYLCKSSKVESPVKNLQSLIEDNKKIDNTCVLESQEKGFFYMFSCLLIQYIYFSLETFK